MCICLHANTNLDVVIHSELASVTKCGWLMEVPSLARGGDKQLSARPWESTVHRNRPKASISAAFSHLAQLQCQNYCLQTFTASRAKHDARCICNLKTRSIYIYIQWGFTGVSEQNAQESWKENAFFKPKLGIFFFFVNSQQTSRITMKTINFKFLYIRKKIKELLKIYEIFSSALNLQKKDASFVLTCPFIYRIEEIGVDLYICI